MVTDNIYLARLLTGQLAAVSQQFIHILLLGQLGEPQLAAQIVAVDDEDFKNAMRIIDLLAARNATIIVGEHIIAPGASILSMLQSEVRMEKHLNTIIESLLVTTPEAQARVARAKAPRGAYQNWLKSKILTFPKTTAPSQDETPKPALLPILLQLMEQTLIHAFLRWHQDDPDAADTAWQMSGAAMLYLTALAPYCGTDEINPKGISLPPMNYGKVDDSFQADIKLVNRCAEAALNTASGGSCDALRLLCQKIFDDCKCIAATQRGHKIKASLGSSKAFAKFGPIRERMCG